MKLEDQLGGGIILAVGAVHHLQERQGEVVRQERKQPRRHSLGSRRSDEGFPLSEHQSGDVEIFALRKAESSAVESRHVASFEAVRLAKRLEGSSVP